MAAQCFDDGRNAAPGADRGILVTHRDERKGLVTNLGLLQHVPASGERSDDGERTEHANTDPAPAKTTHDTNVRHVFLGFLRRSAVPPVGIGLPNQVRQRIALRFLRH